MNWIGFIRLIQNIYDSHLPDLDGMVLSCKPDGVLMKDMRTFIDETRAAVRAS